MSLALDAASIIDAVLAETPLHIGARYAFEYRRSGLVATYRDTLSPDHRRIVADLIAERFEAAGWRYWHRYLPASDVPTSTLLIHPTDASGELAVPTGDVRPPGLGAALKGFADQFGHLDAAHEVGRSLQCSEVAAVAALLSALGRPGAAANWRAAHAESGDEHAEACGGAAAVSGDRLTPSMAVGR
ncbi:hypothetical protein [Streptomyces sp. NRRL B-24484]|uniref:hypothetical protein n=1 Tax=Streptomyces sp. NRRL B-24484 TaxID=1463833 RepID=UPI0004BE9331|nr:hypothetical protein [Streptomyces sp. NRRL B-24484]